MGSPIPVTASHTTLALAGQKRVGKQIILWESSSGFDKAKLPTTDESMGMGTAERAEGSDHTAPTFRQTIEKTQEPPPLAPSMCGPLLRTHTHTQTHTDTQTYTDRQTHTHTCIGHIYAKAGAVATTESATHKAKKRDRLKAGNGNKLQRRVAALLVASEKRSRGLTHDYSENFS